MEVRRGSGGLRPVGLIVASPLGLTPREGGRPVTRTEKASPIAARPRARGAGETAAVIKSLKREHHVPAPSQDRDRLVSERLPEVHHGLR